uniref:PiggyBac transposable element-derived protein 4 C-terminal zinc-ribbon domain-containing protein n=1 Tax=Trichuris muris TaxID=70415 RepID=A0A5S6QGV1_TRIMR
MAAVQFMQGRGQIHDRRICPRCGTCVVLRYTEERDDVLWRCCLKQCRKGVVEIRNLIPRSSTAYENHYGEIRPWSATSGKPQFSSIC